MTAKKIVLVVMCLMLLATVIMTSVVADRVAPMLHAMGRPSQQQPNQTEGSSSVPESGETEESSAETAEPSSEPTETVHEHIYEKLERTQKVTCTTIGYKVYACSCGETKLLDVEKSTGHEWNDGVKKDATCTEDGGKLYTCASCGETKLENKVNAKGHSFGEWAADPTDPYKEIRSCANCDVTESRNAENPNIPTEEPTEEPSEETTESSEPTECEEHDYQLVHEEALTTNAAGKKSYRCSVCEDTYVEYYGKDGVYDLDAVVQAVNDYAEEKGFQVIVSSEMKENDHNQRNVLFRDAEDNGGQSYLIEQAKLMVDWHYETAIQSIAGPEGYKLWIIVYYGSTSGIGTFNMHSYIG